MRHAIRRDSNSILRRVVRGALACVGSGVQLVCPVNLSTVRVSWAGPLGRARGTAEHPHATRK